VAYGVKPRGIPVVAQFEKRPVSRSESNAESENAQLLPRQRVIVRSWAVQTSCIVRVSLSWPCVPVSLTRPDEALPSFERAAV